MFSGALRIGCTLVSLIAVIPVLVVIVFIGYALTSTGPGQAITTAVGDTVGTTLAASALRDRVATLATDDTTPSVGSISVTGDGAARALVVRLDGVPVPADRTAEGKATAALPFWNAIGAALTGMPLTPYAGAERLMLVLAADPTSTPWYRTVLSIGIVRGYGSGSITADDVTTLLLSAR